MKKFDELFLCIDMRVNSKKYKAFYIALRQAIEFT